MASNSTRTLNYAHSSALEAHVLAVREHEYARLDASSGKDEDKLYGYMRARESLARLPEARDLDELLRAHSSVETLLEHGYTFHAMRVCGESTSSLLRKHRRTIEELVKLGATYETLVLGGLRNALTPLVIEDVMRYAASSSLDLDAMRRDGLVGDTIEEMLALGPEALVRLSVTFDALCERYDITLDTLREFSSKYTLAQWRTLGLRADHLELMDFDAARDAIALGWSRNDLRALFNSSAPTL